MRAPYLVVVAVLFALPAAAQDIPPFIPPAPPNTVLVNLNAGYRALSQEFFQQSTFTLYDETGAFEVQHAIEGAFSFEAGGGVRVWKDVAIGAAFSRRSKHTRDVTVTAQVPHPLFPNRFRDAAGVASGLEHLEQAVHIQALWRVPVTIEFDVTLFGGPTFFRLEDELVESVTPLERDAGFSVDLSGIARARHSRSAIGFHAGLDTAYMFMRHIGAGAMLRYSKGSVDLALPPGSVGPAVKSHAGGLELGAGLRVRF